MRPIRRSRLEKITPWWAMSEAGPQPGGLPARGRREVLLRGGRMALGLTLGASLGGSLGLGLLPGPAAAIDWGNLFGRQMPDANGRVKVLEGRAYADMAPLAVGDVVASGAIVAVERGGRMVIALADGALFTLSGGSELELLLSRMRQGILKLIAGALLLVSPKGSQYLVAGTDTSFGIKGTVVYREVFGADNRMATTMEGPLAVPERYGGYFCTCHGSVDYLRPGPMQPFFSDTSDYHHSYFIPRERPENLVRAPMLNHSDMVIRRLVALQEGPKHDLSWLRH